MPRRKLTGKLREQIKRDYRKLKQSEFEGEALSYLKQVRGAHKGKVAQRKLREVKREKIKKAIPSAEEKPGRKYKVIVKGEVIPPGSLAYQIIEASARNKNQSVKTFVSENESEIATLLKDYLIFQKKEIDDLRKLIGELPKGSLIFSPIKNKKISAATASLNLHLIKKTLIDTCEIYPYVFIEYAFDLEANLHFNCPRPGEYATLEDCEELREYLEDRYPNITWIEHTLK